MADPLSGQGEPGCPALVVYDPALAEYDFGASHPMNPARVALTMALAESLGVVGPSGLPLVTPSYADDALLRLVHDADYIDAVRAVTGPDQPNLRYGLGTEDDPTFPRMHDASRLVVGASVEAARRVWTGEVAHAANLAGGLHHAMPGNASGFCVYNDAAIAIRWLLDQGAQRVAYVDVDVHHGDGVEAVFYDDPRVLTISLHETGQMLFPGTGFPRDSGGADAEGMAVNVALPPGTSDSGWLRAFDAVVPPLLRAHAPDIVVSQGGCDSHRDDPLAHLALSVDGQRAAFLAIHDLAHEVADGRWLALGGGGYRIVDVVPRAWTHLLAILAGRPIDAATPVPVRWRETVRHAFGVEVPDTMGDGRQPTFTPWTQGYNPDSWLDRSIEETRAAVFPAHGLIPEP